VSFDSPPTPGKVKVVLRQSENRMKVIRQNHNRIDCKGALLPGRAERQTKRGDIITRAVDRRSANTNVKKYVPP